MCCPAWRLLGVGNPVFSFPFHQRVGRAARQLALPTLPFSPGETGRLKFLRTVVPTTRECPVGSLGPAYWAKGSSSTPGSSEARPAGKVMGPWGRRCSPVAWSSYSRITAGAPGSSPPRACVVRVCNLVAKTNTLIVL